MQRRRRAWRGVAVQQQRPGRIGAAAEGVSGVGVRVCCLALALQCRADVTAHSTSAGLKCVCVLCVVHAAQLLTGW
jgi:hypothetical protein